MVELLAAVDVRVVGDQVGRAADEQVEAHDVPEEEEARVPVGQEEAREVEHLGEIQGRYRGNAGEIQERYRGEEAREVEHQPLGGVQLVDALHTLLARVKANAKG